MPGHGVQTAAPAQVEPQVLRPTEMGALLQLQQQLRLQQQELTAALQRIQEGERDDPAGVAAAFRQPPPAASTQAAAGASAFRQPLQRASPSQVDLGGGHRKFSPY